MSPNPIQDISAPSINAGRPIAAGWGGRVWAPEPEGDRALHSGAFGPNIAIPSPLLTHEPL